MVSKSSSAPPSARTAVFSQISASGRVEQVVQRLTDAIVLGVLVPGERLPSESQLAKRFGVALVTAREGLSLLRENGLIETRRGREGGSFVTPPHSRHGAVLRARLAGLSRVDLQDMGLYLSVITAAAAAHAADRVLDSDIDNLRGLVDPEFPESDQASGRAEGAFHIQLAVLSQSTRLVRDQIRLQAEFGPLLWYASEITSAAGPGGGAEAPGAEPNTATATCLSYQLSVVDALAARDPRGSRAAVEYHFSDHLAQLLDAKAAVDRGDSLEN
ncbi:GntR family transcriptional regulator [Salinibacterium sp. TMP30]|uniref:FadR/GntR family transcriptional regulator n=1 Tax=Salinibacterium sp. TMP30 TaxID=3138237 RepID=UPI003139BD20